MYLVFGRKVAAYLCLIVPLRGTAARAGNHFSKGNQEHAWIAHAVCGQALAFVAYEGSPEHVFALPCLRLVRLTKPLVFEACKPFGAQQRHQMRIQHGRFLVAMAAALSSALLHSPPLVIGIQCPDFARQMETRAPTLLSVHPWGFRADSGSRTKSVARRLG